MAAVTEVRSPILGTELKATLCDEIPGSLLVSIVPICQSSRTVVLVSRGRCQCICCTEHSVNLDGTKNQSENQTKTQTPYVTVGGM